MATFEHNNLLTDSQHGFRKGRSTTTALISLVDEITEAFENKESVQLIRCDLSKHFDLLSHDILQTKK